MSLTAAELAALTSSESEEWSTPRPLFERWDDRYGPLELDVCATTKNALCPRYITAAGDGLRQPWAPARCWMNPPYGETIARWVRKARDEALRGALVVCLLPARTDTRWWHRYVWDRRNRDTHPWVLEIDYLPGRVRFRRPGGAQNAAPFPSAVVVFGKETPCTE